MTAKLGTREQLLKDNFNIELDDHYPYLRGIIEDTSDIISVIKFRKSGMTFAMMCCALLDAIEAGKSVVFITPSRRIYMSEYKRSFERLVKKIDLFDVLDGEDSYKLTNRISKSTIDLICGSSDEYENFDKTLSASSIYIDEVTLNKAFETYESLFPLKENGFHLFMSSAFVEKNKNKIFMRYYKESKMIYHKELFFWIIQTWWWCR